MLNISVLHTVVMSTVMLSLVKLVVHVQEIVACAQWLKEMASALGHVKQ